MFKNIKKLVKIRSVLVICLIMLAVLCILDMFNLPTKLIEQYDLLGLFLVVIIVIFILINKKVINLLKLNVVNYIDSIFLSSIIAITFYVIFEILFNNTIFKTITLISILSIILILSIFRFFIIYRAIKNKKSEENINVYDIRQLYNGEIKNKEKDLIFLEEKDVDYDLLNRSEIINELYNSINLCRNKNRFIISLTGSWGSGKTTILNIVKNKLPKDRFILIDNFDAWKYNNEEYLFYAMFDEIIKKTGVNFSSLELRKFFNLCNNMISSKIDLKFSNVFLGNKSVEHIKETINNYLEVNNKRVVFIIDNLERTNEKNIILILKTIATILDLNRFIYILSYDEKEMKEIFKNKLGINYDYMEKVVQLPLKVPEIDQNDIDRICTKCIGNILINYGIEEKKITEYIPAIKLFSRKINDLRSFKRKINSIFNSNFFNDRYLNRIDLFLLELIREENEELYMNIKANYQYYISEDQIAIYGFSTFNAKEYNEEATKYFDDLFNIPKNKEYKDILRLLFPNVEKYITAYRINNKHVEFWNESPYLIPKDKEEYKKSILERRIYNAKFFDLYFTKHSNEFIEIDNKIIKFVNWINKKKYKIDDLNAIKQIQEKLNQVLYMYIGVGQKYILETLELHINLINNNKLILLLCLIESQNYINDEPIFLGINANGRLEIVCAEIIKNLSNIEIEELKNLIKVNYKNMYFIRKILYWLDPKDKYNKENTNQDLYNDLNSCYKELIENVNKNNINIYDEKNYSRHNIYCLMDNDRYKEQMKNINSETIYRFLADLISNSCGTGGYGYRIDKNNLNKFTTYEKIDEIVNSIDLDNISSVERFILEVYNKSKENEEGIHENTIYKDKYIEIKNI